MNFFWEIKSNPINFYFTWTKNIFNPKIYEYDSVSK